MRAMQCSMCRRPAAWLIDTEAFCEGHKELIIDASGVNRFRIARVTEVERAFWSGSSLMKAKEKPRWRNCSNFPLSKASAVFL
jgi:hypothetical protein